jgi:hypothetical protein
VLLFALPLLDWLGSVDFLMKGDLPSSRKKHAWPLQNLISETADSEKDPDPHAKTKGKSCKQYW